MSIRMRHGRTGLSRLEHERFDRMLSAGELPDVQDEPPRTEPKLPSTPTRTGARPTHSSWFRIMALVKRGEQIDPEFLLETPKLSEAIAQASIYPFRAIVVNCHARQEFDNRKAFEVGGPVL